MTQEFSGVEPVIRPRVIHDGVGILREPAKSRDPNDSNSAANRLYSILSWKRPYDSETEELFARHYLDPIKGMEKDAFGNRHLHIPYPGGAACKIIWSCHIDTCHHDEGYQRLSLLKDKEGITYIGVQKGEGSCLGADDGAGVWLMLEMISVGKPGYYLFHRGEEKGCVGSRWLKDNKSTHLKNFEAAIALDRKDFTNVITHQGGERCCSDNFARAIGRQLENYVPDPTGAFTDTRQYVGLIPECTNLSVGYQLQHGPLERQYVNFALSLRKALIAMDLKSLPIERDPAKQEWRTFGGYGGRNGGSGYNYVDFKDDPLSISHQAFPSAQYPNDVYCWSLQLRRNLRRDEAEFIKGTGFVLKRTPIAEKAANDSTGVDDQLHMSMEKDSTLSLLQLVKKYPIAATKLISELKGNTFDFLCGVYGDNVYLDYMVGCDEEDAARDNEAGIIDATPVEPKE